MIITYHSGECFRVQFGDTVLAFNPPGKRSSIKSNRFGADIALITANHDDMNGADQIGVGERQPFIIDGPGEYEVKGVFVRGFASKSGYGGEPIGNTIYTVALEGMNICFLGVHEGVELPSALQQTLEHIDILFVPVGGAGTLSAADAAKVAVEIEPSIVIPMSLSSGKDAETARKQFAKEMGATNVTPVDKLTLKKKDLEGKNGEVVILESSAS